MKTAKEMNILQKKNPPNAFIHRIQQEILYSNKSSDQGRAQDF